MIHSKNHVSNLDDSCIQPNAVDLRLLSLARLDCDTNITLTENTKEFHSKTVVKPWFCPTAGEDMFILRPGVYEFTTQHDVDIPEGCAGWLVIRSTLARNGMLIGNGLYDAGYSGIIGGVLHVSGNVRIQTNLRIAQFIMIKAETGHLYDGHYNATRGYSIEKNNHS